MKVLFRGIAVFLIAIAAFLIYAVINALGSEGGAKPGVAVGYVIGAIVLGFAALSLWRAAKKRGIAAPAQV
ncbi:MAG: hypothetical protein QOC95_2756 [Thermoleophilaceae bacterium]|jgi:hypothetical protein|nr:hypothetical protein [Thermoleophilaceae bacterium]